MTRKILVVGSASAAARLRRIEEHAEIILFEREDVMMLPRWSRRLKLCALCFTDISR